MYISRRYLKEKYDALKFDMEKVLNIYDAEEDKIPEEDVKRVKANLTDKIKSIATELGLNL